MRYTRSFLITGLLCLATSVCLLPRSARATTPNCRSFFQTKSYLKAAKCFERVAKQSTGTTEKSKVIRGRQLRNAAIAYRLAAKNSKRVDIATHYRERATEILQRYIDQKLYEHTRRRNSALALQQLLQKKIKYALLTVVTGSKNAKIHIKGFRTEKRTAGQWSGKLRPGKYTLLVHYTKPMPKQVKRVLTLIPGKTKLLALQPPKSRAKVVARIVVRRPPPRRLPTPKTRAPLWVPGVIILSAGIAALASGAVVYGVGRSAELSKRALNSDGPRNSTNLQQLERYDGQARTMMPVGVTVMGAGGAMLGTGGLMMFLAKRQ